MNKSIDALKDNLSKKKKGSFNQEFKGIKDIAKELPSNEIWFGGDLYDHLLFPIFSIEK